MANDQDDNESRRVRLARWMIPPARGWRRKTSRLTWRPLLVPLLSLVLILIAVGVTGFLAVRHPAEAEFYYLVQLALLISGGVTIGWIVRRVRRQLLEPLSHLRNWSLRVRGGNLSARIPMPDRGGGEFAELARDMNQLGEELKTLSLEMDAQVNAQTDRLARKTRFLQILYDIATSLNRPQNLDELLNRFLDTFMEMVGARAAVVCVLTEGGSTRLVASRGLDPNVSEKELLEDANNCRAAWSESHSGIRILQGSRQSTKLFGSAMRHLNMVEYVAVPVQYQDQLLGMYSLFLDRSLAEIDEDMRELLNSVSRQLGLAIVKARLDKDARRLAIIEERNIIGNELHDSLAQSLVSMRLHVKMLGEMLYKKDVHGAQNEVRRLNAALSEAHASLRELLANFRSRMDQRGLLPAIEDMVIQFREETGIATFFHNECTEINLSPAQEIQVFRIIQEALANVRKHSQAHTARILLRSQDGQEYFLLIEDDGLGITPSTPSQRGEHVGLEIMRERAGHLPGILSIESEPGEGTRIHLSFRTGPQASGLQVAGGG